MNSKKDSANASLLTKLIVHIKEAESIFNKPSSFMRILLLVLIMPNRILPVISFSLGKNTSSTVFPSKELSFCTLNYISMTALSNMTQKYLK